MIRSTMVLTAVLSGLAAPVLAQDRRTDEAEAAAARAEEAAADVLRASQGLNAPMEITPREAESAASESFDVEATAIEPLYVEPPYIEPIAAGPLASAPTGDMPFLAIEWVAEPVVQPLGKTASVGHEELAHVEEATIDDNELALEDAAEEAEPADDAARVPGEPQLAYASPLEDAAPSTPRPARRTTRRVRLGYSPEERDAWLAQCRVVYRGSYDCDGYLAHYEQALGAAPGDRRMPARATAP